MQVAAADESGICLLAWKRRTGWAAEASHLWSSASLLPRKPPQSQSAAATTSSAVWVERWIVVCTQSGELRYYAVDDDNDNTNNAAPRGCIDLIQERPQITVASKLSSDAPTRHELDISVVVVPSTSTTTEDSTSSSSSSKKPQHWRFCFHTQQDLMQFLQVTHRVQDAAGQYSNPTQTTLHHSLDFEHEFQAADHVYRWEMICCPPVIYPIQIHGIVLDAGRNCVVLADFGLTGYSNRNNNNKGQKPPEFNHQQSVDEQNQQSHHAILEAYYNKLLRPSNHQRLNIVTLTDPLEIRKWTKANYDDAKWGCATNSSSSAKKLAQLSKFLSKLSTTATTKKKSKTTKASSSSSNDAVIQATSKDSNENDNDDDDDDDHTEGDLSQSQSRDYDDDEAEVSLEDSSLDRVHSQGQSMDSSESSVVPRNNNNKEQLPLPRSDPVPIVLARANFLLEHEDKLPPYHVLYSNSECIAVWCKTGRWSTLQTAVFLSTNAVGGAKSATLATLGVAAAHALLAPVVAVGGLIWVSTPLWLLQKARHKWQAATEQMNQVFWAQAEPRVFVAAIEHWSGMTMAATTTTTTMSSSSVVAAAADDEEGNATAVENDDINAMNGDEQVDERPSETLSANDNGRPYHAEGEEVKSKGGVD
jgi:hypothetical protein